MPATLDFRLERLMDALSRLIRLAGLQASLDLRCLLADAYRLDHYARPSGEMPFHVVLAGRCRVEVDGIAPFEMRAGDFLLLPQGTPHAIGSASLGIGSPPLTFDLHGSIAVRRNTQAEPDVDLLCGSFIHASGAGDALLRTLPPALHVSLRAGADVDQLQQVVELIRREVARDEPGAIAVVSALSTALFALALREAGRTGSAAPGLVRVAADVRLAPVVQAVLHEPGQDWSMDRLSDAASMSRATFARRFGEVAGQTPGDFVQHVRLGSAAEQLLETDRAVADIAERVGYRSDVAFAKAFRRVIGVTPAVYRRNGRGRGQAA